MTTIDARSLVNWLGNWTERRGPLHRRLADSLHAVIRNGLLPPQARLPGERPLAKELALSRTTVVNAYNSLRADGLLESRSGSGTWVCPGPAAAARHHAREAALAQSPMLNLLSIDDQATVDFALGTPSPLAELPAELYSVGTELQRLAMKDRGHMPLGFPPLREAVARDYTARGVPTDAAQVLVTSGAQQAIHLIVSWLVQRGDRVVIETPAFFGALSALRLAGADLRGVEVGRRHVDPDAVRAAVRERPPRLIHVTPTWHNPTGAVMPGPARQELAALAREFGVPLVEDGTMADVAVDDGWRLAPIAAHAPRDTVLSIGSLSKLLWAGLRIGWVRGPAGWIQQLGRLKSASDLGSPVMTQGIATQLLGALEQARALRRAQLARRSDLLAGLLRTHFPEWQFELPAGGLFLWVRAPGYDLRYLAQAAARHGVALTPGSLFSVDDGHREYLRLPYLLDESLIELGVARMAAAWRDCRGVSGERELRGRAIA